MSGGGPDSTHSLTSGSVYVSQTRLGEYSDAAQLEGITRAQWIRDTLNKAAACIRKKHSD
jgi:hypothetical protein